MGVEADDRSIVQSREYHSPVYGSRGLGAAPNCPIWQFCTKALVVDCGIGVRAMILDLGVGADVGVDVGVSIDEETGRSGVPDACCLRRTRAHRRYPFDLCCCKCMGGSTLRNHDS